jgi:hypothetical protein
VFEEQKEAHSTTRWGSYEECLKQMYECDFPAKTLEWAHLMVAGGVSPAYAPKIVTMLEDPNKRRQIHIELAATVIVGEKITICTYSTEADALGGNQQDIIFAAQRHLERVRIMFCGSSILQDNKDIQDLASKFTAELGSMGLQECLDYMQFMDAAECAVQPIATYFLSKFGRSCGDISGCDFEDFMKVVRVAHIFNPAVAACTPRGQAMTYLADLTVVPVIIPAVSTMLACVAQ